MQNAAKIRGQIRHALGALGVFLVAQGHTDEASWAGFLESWDGMVGGAFAVIAFAWSWFSSDKRVGSGDLK